MLSGLVSGWGHPRCEAGAADGVERTPYPGGKVKARQGVVFERTVLHVPDVTIFAVQEPP